MSYVVELYVTEVNRKTSKHERYFVVTVEGYRQIISSNAFFFGVNGRNKSPIHLYHAYHLNDLEFMASMEVKNNYPNRFNSQYMGYVKDGTAKRLSLYDFYAEIGYDKKKNKYTPKA